jgi:hypothetical protein
MARIGARFKSAVVKVELPDGSTKTLTGMGLSNGKDTTFAEADAALAENKAATEESGERVGRGSKPLGATDSVVQGQQDHVGEVGQRTGLFGVNASVAKGARRSRIGSSAETSIGLGCS